jgi:hypothetical protein
MQTLETPEILELPEIKKGKGRPRQYDDTKLHRQDLMIKLKNEGYFREYYEKRNIKVNCPNCNKECPEINLKQHQRGKKCKAFVKPPQQENKSFFIFCKIINL